MSVESCFFCGGNHVDTDFDVEGTRTIWWGDEQIDVTLCIPCRRQHDEEEEAAMADSLCVDVGRALEDV